MVNEILNFSKTPTTVKITQKHPEISKNELELEIPDSMDNQNDSMNVSTPNENLTHELFAVRLLRSLEMQGLKFDYSRLKKEYSTDAWWIYIGEEVTGPHALDEVLLFLLKGGGSVAVVHESLSQEEFTPWRTLSYRPVWLNPLANFFWKIGFGAAVASLIFAIVAFLIPGRFVGYYNIALAPMVFLGALWQFPKCLEAILRPVRRGLLPVTKLASVRNVTAVTFLAMALLLFAGYRRLTAVPDTLNGVVPGDKSLVISQSVIPSSAPIPATEEKPVAVAPTPEPSAPLIATAEATPAPEEVVTPKPADETVDLAQLSQSPAEWPKTVVLKKAVEFPAVFNGKVLGSVKTSPGTPVRLTTIQAGKIGVEYHGGNAMVEVDDTDLIAQILAVRHRHPNT